MLLEIVRAISDYLQDGTSGVNAQLNSMTTEGLYDSGDSKPEDIATITDETRNEQAAFRTPPTDTSGVDKPSLIVFVNNKDPVIYDPPNVAQNRFRADVTVTILFYSGEKANTEEAARDAYYYLRATLRSIRDFNCDDSAKKRNSVVIEHLNTMRTEPIFQEPGSKGLSWAIVMDWEVADNAP